MFVLVPIVQIRNWGSERRSNCPSHTIGQWLGEDMMREGLTLGGRCRSTIKLSCFLLRGWKVERHTCFFLWRYNRFVILGHPMSPSHLCVTEALARLSAVQRASAGCANCCVPSEAVEACVLHWLWLASYAETRSWLSLWRWTRVFCWPVSWLAWSRI